MHIGIVGLTGCSGCQCQFLNIYGGLSKLLERAKIDYFPLLQDDNVFEEFDVIFVEGSVTCGEDKEKLKLAREKARVLVALGSCACYGGIQASIEETACGHFCLPVSEVVEVDCKLPGCPVGVERLLESMAFLVNGVKPFEYPMTVCHECRINENDCIILKGGICQGPITLSGCGAPCPQMGVGCVGCRGDSDFPNYEAFVSLCESKGIPKERVEKLLFLFRRRR